MKDIIYLDNASTTPLSSEVLDSMLPYLTSNFGNANSVHQLGRKAVDGLDFARETVAKIIGANINEVYFTSGGTESDNFAIRGAFYANDKKKKFVTSSIEHPAVLQTTLELEKQGAEIIKIKPNKKGIVNPLDFEKQDLSNAFLVSLMLANNEIGTFQPVKEVASICKKYGAISFTDAVQAVGVCDINVKELGVDMMAFSGHKFNGPKGVGVLYIKSGTAISPQITGGHQERLKRGGTSNVAGAVGLATALKISRRNLNDNVNKLKTLKDLLINGLITSGLDVKVNGDETKILPTIASVTFNGVDANALLCALDLNGVCASLGSACSSGSVEPSYVLKEIGLSDRDAKSTLRFSLGVQNTKAEIENAIKIIKSCVNSLQS